MARMAKERFQPEQHADGTLIDVHGHAWLVGMTEPEIRFLFPYHHISYFLGWYNPYEIQHVLFLVNTYYILPQLVISKLCAPGFLRLHLENDPIRKKI